MTQHPHVTASHRLDYDRTLILAVEVSGRSWVVAAQVPGFPAEERQAAARAPRRRAHGSGRGLQRRGAAARVLQDRVIVAYESGGSGFWLARWLEQHGVEVHVMQPSSVPVDRRMRRAKSDRIDADMLLRTLLVWLRGEPRVCSMVPVPDEATEDARRPIREREELIRARVAIVNRIEAVLTVLCGASTTRCGATAVSGWGSCAPSSSTSLPRRSGADRAPARSPSTRSASRWPTWKPSAIRSSRTRRWSTEQMIQPARPCARHRCADRNRAGPRGLRAPVPQRPRAWP